MRSMKEPLGIVDTRVKMTDTPPDGLLSQSFSSVIAFDDPPQYTTTALDDFRTLDFSPKRNSASDETDEPTGERGRERRHPRLELDVALDKYHILDGCAEPLNPQNTPASYSGCNSPGEMATRSNENLRTRSAPASQALGLSWSEDKSQGDLIYFHGDGGDGVQTWKLQASEASPPSSVSSPDATKNAQPTTVEGTNKEAIGDASAILRCVRFSPPVKSHRSTNNPIQRPIPSVECKEDYIASYRQHRQREKWGSPNRARIQRYAPYRSPNKIPLSHTTRLNRQPDSQFSPRDNSPSRRNERSRSPSVESRDQSPSRQENRGVTSASADNLEPSDTNPVAQQAYDLGLVSFSLYQFRMPGTWRFSLFQLEIRSSMIPMTARVLGGPSERADSQIRVENLLFHVSFIVPAIILRVLSRVTSAAKPVGQSRVSRAACHLIKALWLLFERLIQFVARTLGLGGFSWTLAIVYREAEPPI